MRKALGCSVKTHLRKLQRDEHIDKLEGST